jgi:transcriptional regulator with XRE-family HTH domain
MANDTVSIGEALRRFRQRKGISQFDLAVAMGWKGTNPVIQIEKGRRLPRPDTIERLGVCLGLSYVEVHYLNGLGGYVPPTRLPPQDHVIRTLDQLAGHLARVPYPAAVLDYQYRCWVINPAGLILIDGDPATGRAILARPLDVLQIVFDSRLAIRARIADLENTEKEMTFSFKAINSFRQHEPFFRSLPERHAAVLTAEDYQHFARVWRAVDLSSVERFDALQVADFYARMEEGDIRLRFPECEVVCYIRREAILHLGDLFQVMTFLPLDPSAHPDNRARAEAIFERYTPTLDDSLKVWELLDVTPWFEG